MEDEGFDVRRVMKVIDQELLDHVSAEAKESPRLRMNYNFHQSLEDKCHRLRYPRPLLRLGKVHTSMALPSLLHRLLNAVEPGTVVPIHRHPSKDESFVLLRGKVKVSTFNDDGSVMESVVLCQEDGRYGVDIPKGVWHNLEAIEPNSVIFECKEGPFVPHEEEGILDLKK